jgi:hypothetical protein
MPLFVTFGDKNDPSTLVRAPEDRFETILGTYYVVPANETLIETQGCGLRNPQWLGRI